jgi:hypothetical protein
MHYIAVFLQQTFNVGGHPFMTSTQKLAFCPPPPVHVHPIWPDSPNVDVHISLKKQTVILFYKY